MHDYTTHLKRIAKEVAESRHSYDQLGKKSDLTISSTAPSLAKIHDKQETEVVNDLREEVDRIYSGLKMLERLQKSYGEY